MLTLETVEKVLTSWSRKYKKEISAEKKSDEILYQIMEDDLAADSAAEENVETDTIKATLEIKPPPNCYENGKIKAYIGELEYSTIYKYTSQPLKIYKDGRRQMPCQSCDVTKKYQIGEYNRSYRHYICGDCKNRTGGYETYLQRCNTAALNLSAHALNEKGLNRLVDNIGLGYDAEKKCLIFPLNGYQYVTLGYDGKEFTQSRAEVLKVLMHYNRTIEADGGGGFKAAWTPCKLQMPYLDNRFYGTGGEEVIATGLSLPDETTLPFPSCC